ncbi:MAG: very short patch repair endonuclease [Bacteroidetes bacterium]|nr:very short patch repair endonuclease [Bacteroidota bacterium]MBK8365375.1 very short patch repair endonuclease [Bacteroidota bacterium]
MKSVKKEYVRDKRSPKPLNRSVSKVMSSNKAMNTKPELKLRRAIWNKGLRGYRLHWKVLPGSPDIAFSKQKVAIFVNGCFWHRCPICNLTLPKTNSIFWKDKFNRNVERDKRKSKELKKAGWISIVIWECQVKSNLENCVYKIQKIVSKNLR